MLRRHIWYNDENTGGDHVKATSHAGSQVKSVDKAMGIVELLLSQRRPMSLQELSTSSSIPKSTIHAILATLRDHSVVEQRDDGRYYLGVRLFECGCAVAAEWDITKVAHPHLVQLAEQTGASSYIALLDGSDCIVFDQYVPASGSGLQIHQEPGSRQPLHATAQGKLLLSSLSNPEVLNRLNDRGMQAFTRHTITDPQKFLAELESVRQAGYALEDGEYKVGMRAISAPVYNQSHQLKYAVGVVGLFSRVASDDFQHAIAQTLHQARQLSLAIGWREPQ